MLCFLTQNNNNNNNNNKRDLVSDLRREILILKILSQVWSGEITKKSKDKQICNDLSASIEASFCYSCLLHMNLFMRERERERERDENCMDVWISKCVVVVILVCRMCGGKKISSGQWYCYPLVHLLFVIWKVKK